MHKLNDAVFDALATRGYAIVHNFLPESQRAEMAAALRRIPKPWDEAKENLPAKFSANCHFPYPELCLNRAIFNREAIAFSRRWIDTDQSHYRPGLGLVTYPGRKNMSFHIDNGNNSLLPPTESDRSYSQLNFWFCLEDVDPDQGPTLLSADGQRPTPGSYARRSDDRPRWLGGHLPQLQLALWQRLPSRGQPTLHLEIRLWPCRPLLGGRRALHPCDARPPFP